MSEAPFAQLRGEREMLDLILGVARGDERVRAVALGGSRANPRAPRDWLQDYDITYLVTEVGLFTADHRWIDLFGPRTILQMPEEMEDPPPSRDGTFGYLIQLADGNRIDLGLLPLEQQGMLADGAPCVVLLDKDGRLAELGPGSGAAYIPPPPTAKAFDDCCNEFWWVCLNVGKGLWRDEITYARHMADVYVREQLMKMLAWHVGVGSGFTADPGKLGKYLRQTLRPDLWELLLQTYADADVGRSWEALLAMGRLFRAAALDVAAHGGLSYPHGDDARVTRYLLDLRSVPRAGPGA